MPLLLSQVLVHQSVVASLHEPCSHLRFKVQFRPAVYGEGQLDEDLVEIEGPSSKSAIAWKCTLEMFFSNAKHRCYLAFSPNERQRDDDDDGEK